MDAAGDDDILSARIRHLSISLQLILSEAFPSTFEPGVSEMHFKSSKMLEPLILSGIVVAPSQITLGRDTNLELCCDPNSQDQFPAFSELHLQP